ncbi:sigma-70 family RNA polymerase sigma factor [Candidatus Microgenomates bacterium]|nr:MAG: sigma-70 family RNA polymerase sigma factor [Candidatus Microgenomates bacterium]
MQRVKDREGDLSVYADWSANGKGNPTVGRMAEDVFGPDYVYFMAEVRQYPLLNYEEVLSIGKSMEKGRVSFLLLQSFYPSPIEKKDVFVAHLSEEGAREILLQMGLDNIEPIMEVNKKSKKKEEFVAGFKSKDGTLPCLDKKKLEKDIEIGRESQIKLISHNLLLVVDQAKKRLASRVPILDLIQEGSIGLVRAVRKFDYRRGFTFSTHATPWISQALSRGEGNLSRIIHIPVHKIEKVGSYLKKYQTLEQNLGYAPTVGEIMESFGMDLEEIIEINELIQQKQYGSLEAELKEDDETGLLAVLKDPNPVGTPLSVEKARIDEFEQGLIDKLDDREKRMVIKQTEGKKLEKIGKEENPPLSKERIRQITDRAWQKIGIENPYTDKAARKRRKGKNK